MEGDASSDDRLRSSRRLADLCGDEPEEGEFVPGYHSDADTEEYYNNLPGCSSDLEGTISDSAPAINNGAASTASSATAINNGGGGASSAAAAVAALACPFCGKEFRNHKAVCGHMKVHREQGIRKAKKGKVHRREQGIGKAMKGIKRDAAVVGGWGGTAKRGCSVSKGWAASPIAESDQSMAVAVAEAKMIVLQPMPLAFAPPNLAPNPPPVPTASATSNLSSVAVESAAMANDSVESNSAQPMRDNAMEAVAAGAASPPTEAVVHPQAAPPPSPAAAGEHAPPVNQQPVGPPPPPGGRQDPKGYTCKKCGMWFRTHQGLGGHVVGHRNRELAAAREGGAASPDHGIAKPVKAHVCKVCGAEFLGGIQLGGHMRKHWTGASPNKKSCPVIPLLPSRGAATVGVAALTVALSIKPDEASPAPKPAVVGRVLLFGIDIGAGVKTPAAQEGSSASTTTGGEQ